jgi:phage baseplate assembly protein W
MFNDHKKSFLGRGWAFPPTFGENGRLGMVELEADIRESIYILLSTLPGERILNPRFGCDLHSQVFREIDSNTIAQIRGMVASAILKFEPRVDLEKVEVDGTRELDGFLDIEIEYTVRSINSRTNMVYPFYLKEGTDLPEY